MSTSLSLLTEHKSLFSACSIRCPVHRFAHWQLPILVRNVLSRWIPLFLQTLPSIYKMKSQISERHSCRQLKNCSSVSAYRLPWFIFVGHNLKLPIMVAFTTSWPASLKQPCSLLIRCVKTVFLTSEMFPSPLRQLPWKYVTEFTLRSFGPGLGRKKKIPQINN